MSKSKQENIWLTAIRYLLWVVAIILLLLMLLSMALSKPKVQNWVVGKVSEKMSERLQANISIDSVSLDIKRGIKIWDFALKDQSGDTLLIGSELSSSLADNIISVLDSKLSLRDIYLKDIYINVDKAGTDSLSNWQEVFVQNQKQGPVGLDKPTEKRPFFLDVDHVELENIRYRNKSAIKEQVITLEYGILKLDKIDLDSLIFQVNNIELRNPTFELYELAENKGVLVSKDNSKNHSQDGSNEDEQTTKFPRIYLDHLHIYEGQIWTSNRKTPKSKKEIDYKNLRIDNLFLDAEEIRIENPTDISFVLNDLTGKLDEKIELQNTSCSQFQLSEKSIEMADFVLQTPYTDLRADQKLKFRSIQDFKDFPNKVFLDLDIDDSKISFEDLIYLVPGIRNSKLIQTNQKEMIRFDGKIKGRVNNFSTTDLMIEVPDKIKFLGTVRVRNITDPAKSLINIEVDHLLTSMNDLKSVIPNFMPPSNFYKLGDIDFKGRFDGFIFNFVAFGELNTGLGSAISDMQLDLTDGRNNAKYSGSLELVNFDLAKWSDNPEFDKVSLITTVKNGSGLVLNNAKADLDAVLSTFKFRGHQYQDVELIGKLEKNTFDGVMNLADPFADFNFDGSIVYDGENFTGDFKAKVNKLDLHGLNLSKDSLSFSGDLDIGLSGINIDNFEGEANVRNMDISLGENTTHFDSIYLVSSPDRNGNRIIQFESDLLDLVMNGKFNFTTMGDDIKQLLFSQHPTWTEYLGVKQKSINENQKFNFKIHVKDSENLFALLDQPDLKINGLKAEGMTDTGFGKIAINSNLDSASFKNYKVTQTDLNFMNLEQDSDIKFETANFFMNGKKYEDVDLDLALISDKLYLHVNSGNLLDTIGTLDFTIEAQPEGKDLIIHLEEKDWFMLGEQWSFNERNEIILGKKSISIKDLTLSDGERNIEFSSRNGSDVLLHVSDLDLSLINPIIDDPKFTFFGSSFINFQALNVFDKPSIQGSFVVPDLYFNDESFGELNLILEDHSTDMLKVDLNLYRAKDDQMIVLDALVNQRTMDTEGVLTADNFQLAFFEHIILNGISNTQGNLDLEVQLKGKLSELRTNGRAITNDCQVTIDYLGTTAFFDEQEIRINEKVIDVTGGIITDRLGNEAVLTGGLFHNYLTDFTMGLNISSDQMLLLDTDKSDNPSYYGTALGKTSVNFSGSFQQAEISVNGTTGPGTVLSIPVESSVTDFEESFVQFVEKGTLLDQTEDTLAVEEFLLEGANIEINLSITPDAEVKIIFDERLNDVIVGRGNANMRIISERNGTFDMFGQYTVETGEYLFTALGIVAKPFEVKRGSTITWTGDPLNASVNIEADYTGIRTSMDVFLSEYLLGAPQSLIDEASRKTKVLLDLIITGTLFDPDINFGLTFPDLQGELKSFADSKMTTLRSNPTDLNDQVAGLLIFGSFLPADNPLANLGVGSGILFQSTYNTLSEFMTNQLSYLLSSLLEEAFIDNGLISGLDFEIGFSKSLDIVESPGLAPDEVEVVFKPKFKNDRWSANFGTNYVRQSIFNTDNYAYLDVVLEYKLTADGKLRLKMYGKNDYDVQEQERENQFGAGVRYRTEFGNMTEIKEVFKQQIKADLNGIERLEN